jgi:methionyl-tRNA formyltransferase
MSELRILFMGTPEFAVASLDALLKAKYNIVGVITAPDRPAGRGRKLRQSAVKEYALQNNLQILQPTNLKDPYFLEKLKELKVDLQIVVAFRMLPKQVWAMPRLGTFNLHASLLPDYRGAAPINWAIINGEEKSGVTTFFINEKIDTGAIILQEEVEIPDIFNAGDLHDELMETGSKLLTKTVDWIESNNHQIKEQELTEEKPAPKLNKENCKINWNASIDEIYNHIRGLSPYPAAWTTFINNEKSLEVKIYKTEMIKETHAYISGSIISTKKYLKVAVKNGFINVLELKLAGKRKMDIVSLLNGVTIHENAKMV